MPITLEVVKVFVFVSFSFFLRIKKEVRAKSKANGRKLS